VSYAALESELSALLLQSSQLLGDVEPAAIDAARPAVYADGSPAHLGSAWLRSLPYATDAALPVDFLQLRTDALASRKHQHLLLLSRVQSMQPLLTWWHRRVTVSLQLRLDSPASASVAATAQLPSDADPECPPLRLPLDSLVALLVTLRHMRSLYAQVQLELTALMPMSGDAHAAAAAAAVPASAGASASLPSLSSRMGRWLSSSVAALTSQLPHLNEFAATSALPAMELWIRLVECADLAKAAVPYRDAPQSTPKHVEDAAAAAASTSPRCCLPIQPGGSMAKHTTGTATGTHS
jgi:hypothetical protein